MNLPKPAHKWGYTDEQIKEICKKLGVTRRKFFKNSYAHTCSRDPELGFITYSIHVENAFENAVRNIEMKRGES